MPEIRINDPERDETNHPVWDAMLNEHAEHHHHGAEFLTWHSEFIARFASLLNSLPEADRPAKESIEPWTEIPEALKKASIWKTEWDEREDRLQGDIASFKSLEELANFINPLHAALHGAVAEVYNDPNIASVETAPRSTYFWQLHGLIERWYQKWRSAQPAV